MQRVGWFGLTVITLCAFAVRVYELDAQSLWYDEGVTAEVARRGIAELTRWTAGDIQPPLYYYVVAAWGRIAGWSEWSLRFPSVFFGVLLVPLLAAAATALSRRRTVGLLAGLFAAFHPLLVYYSQEARMYAMLTCLGVLLGYLVIHAETGLRQKWLHWSLYVLVAVAAVYTHYFAFFLLLAFAIVFLLDQFALLPPVGVQTANSTSMVFSDAIAGDPLARGPVFGFVVANVGILALYLPWFTALFTRLSVDTSYWQGQLKLWEAVRHTAISFTSGETVLEAEATRLLLPYGLLTLVLVLVLLLRSPRQGRTLLYGLLWLALPITAILLLALAVPKFNARYGMIAVPGLILIWSAGLGHLLDWRNFAATAVALPARILSFLALLLAGVLLAGFLYADYNWFTDPAFTKAEWRELSHYLRSQLVNSANPASSGQATSDADSTDESLVVLVSGHAWPVWSYYAPDLPPLRLPDLEILDVNAALDFSSSAAPLRDALRGKTDAWLVQWQEQVVDPMDIVPLQLKIAGQPQEVDEPFWHLRLQHYSNIRPDEVLTEPVGITANSINFGNLVNFLDSSVTEDGDLLLFWQLHPDLVGQAPDLYVTGHTFTADGLPFMRLADRRPAGYEYPSFRWRPGQVLVGQIPAQEWAGPGALPGTYRLRFSLYDGAGDLTGIDIIGPQGQPLGKHITLDVPLRKPTTGPDTDNKVSFAEVIPDLFVEVALAAEQAEPGQAVGAELRWYAEEKPPGDYNLHVRWRLRADERLVGEQTLPLSPALPTHRWPDDEILRTLHQFRPPLDLAPDDYWLEIGLAAPGNLIGGNEEVSRYVRVPFRVLGSTRLFTAPPYATEIDVVFGDALKLLGVIEPIESRPEAGQQVVLTLVWQALDRLPADYSSTIQWLGEDAKPHAQADMALPGGSSNWLPQQVELQTMFVKAPAEPGNYRLVTAVYDANQPDLPRLYTQDGRDLVELGTITVLPAQ